METIAHQIASEINVKPTQVSAAIGLLDEVRRYPLYPAIARKSQGGSMTPNFVP